MVEELLNSKDDFILVPISKEMKVRACIRAESLGCLNNSITSGEGNYAGFIGEDAVKTYLNASYSDGSDVFNNDLILFGKTIEVKSKRRNVSPNLYYDVSIAKTSRHQNPDIYVFTSVNETKVWILGWIYFEKFYSLSKFIPKGTVDKTNNFVCHTDMFNLRHCNLNPIRNLVYTLSNKED